MSLWSWKQDWRDDCEKCVCVVDTKDVIQNNSI